MKDSSFNCPDDATEFLTKLVNFFKITNVKGQVKDVHTNDETRAVLSFPDHERLNFLLSLADMVVKMSCKRQVVRVKQLSKDTSHAFSHTCRGMDDITKHLLKSDFSYVLVIFLVIQSKKCLANSIKVQDRRYLLHKRPTGVAKSSQL